MPSGSVGIGTSSPGAAYKLDVAGSVNASGLCLGGDCKTAWSQVGGGTTSQWANGASSSINYGAGGLLTAEDLKLENGILSGRLTSEGEDSTFGEPLDIDAKFSVKELAGAR